MYLAQLFPMWKYTHMFIIGYKSPVFAIKQDTYKLL